MNTATEMTREQQDVLLKNWSSLIKPTEYCLTSISLNSAVFQIEPLERGFGVTLGNSLRRIMLSSLQGAAITAVKIEGVEHEYTTIPGVMEDVVTIVLNLKSIVFSHFTTERKKLRLSVSGPCTVTAGDIEEVAGIEIINKDLVICHVDTGGKIEMDLLLGYGKGYIPANGHKGNSSLPIGMIPIDSMFSPVRRVTYRVENSRVGSDTEYDRLFMTIETNGALHPDKALGLAAKIIQDQLQVFISFKDIIDVPKSESVDAKEKELPFDPKLLIKIDVLELSVRSQNCLKNDNIIYIGDLVTKTEHKMLHMPNFGRKSLNEIKDLLSSMGLGFGMEVSGWPPSNIEDLAKKYEEKNHG